MERILITSGVSSFSQRAASLFLDAEVMFADSNPIPLLFVESGKYISIPFPEKASFIHEVLKACLDLSITKLLPLRADELMPLSESRALFDEYGISILVPTVEVLATISKHINPTRTNSEELILKPFVDEAGLSGVFKKGDQGELLHCCLK